MKGATKRRATKGPGRVAVAENILALCRLHHEELASRSTTEMGRGDVEPLEADDYRQAYEEAGQGRVVDLDPNNL